MAAASHLTLLSHKPRTLQSFRANASCSAVSPPPLFSGFKKQIMGVVAGGPCRGAASIVAADATRIEYFATVSEPPCELTFVRSGLGYCDVVVGSGDIYFSIHYTARFADGIVFDSNYNAPRRWQGLDQGILGGGVPPMQVGECNIPANATLVYDVNFVNVYSGNRSSLADS